MVFKANIIHFFGLQELKGYLLYFNNDRPANQSRENLYRWKKREAENVEKM